MTEVFPAILDRRARSPGMATWQWWWACRSRRRWWAAIAIACPNAASRHLVTCWPETRGSGIFPQPQGQQ